ncbi:MAG: SCO family protein [Bacteroidota bacterium]
MKKYAPYLSVGLILAVAVFFGAGYYYSLTSKAPDRILPFYGPAHADTIKTGSSVAVNKTWHTVPGFKFTDQLGKQVSEHDFTGKIYVTDFFFTTCPGICPKMTRQLERVYSAYPNTPELMLLSHTVNPEEDSVAVLKEYADKRHADPNRWKFVTGAKPEIYDMARKGYFLTETQGLGDAEDFVHTQNFALIDKERHIRGIYDGTDSTDVNRLIADIGQLLKFYAK